MQKYDKAIELFEKAASIETPHALLLNNLGSACLASAKLPKAMEAFEKSLELDPKNAVTHYNIAVTAKMMNDFQKAYKFFKSAYKLDPSPFYLSSLAAASLDAEDFDEAVKSANLSTDRVLWIRAKSQSGLNRSYTIELTQPKDSKKK